MLSGYKTYLVAAASIFGALASYASGDLNLADTLNICITALLAATIRHGVSNA